MIRRWRQRLLIWLLDQELRRAERALDFPWDRRSSLRVDQLVVARDALERIWDER